jgi:uncharacterized membrane protein (DUF2068 family)
VTSPGQKQQESNAGGSIRPGTSPGGLRLIAVYKLFKGLVLFGLGVGAIKLLHRHMGFDVEQWADIFRADPGNRYIHRLLEKLSIVDSRKLREFSAGTFFYAALQLTEGTGLLLGKGWAKYFTIISTSIFIPLEIYEIARRVSPVKIAVLLINVAVVLYLVNELCRAAPARKKRIASRGSIPPSL